MDYEQHINKLNAEQRKAVDSIEGPLMVLAGPGTGKTQLLSLRTANILRQTDLFPSNILILTYTNAGVKAMRERLAQVIGANGYEVVVETFHGFANSIITESEEAATVKGERIEMTDLERITLLEHLLDHIEGIKSLRHPNAPYLYRGDIQSNISALKRDGISPQDFEEFLRSYKADEKLIEEKHVQRLKAFVKFYDAYEEAKLPNSSWQVFDQRGRYDYDDMILLATQALQQEPELLAKIQEQYQYVMVDEFQDTNGAQLKLLKTIFSDRRSNICVVGDDDQSIYRFQGASAGNFQIFDELFLKVEKILLQKNYRSFGTILEKSALLVGQIPAQERVAVKILEAVRGDGEAGSVASHRLGTIEEELTFLVRQIKDIPDAEKNNTAILVRTRKDAQLIIESLLQSGIPYTTDGKEDIRGEFRIQQLIKILHFAQANLDFEARDLLLFEILLFDFWQIDHHDLMSLVASVKQKQSDARKRQKRRSQKSSQDYQQEERQEMMTFASEVGGLPHEDAMKTSLLTELLLRFPPPKRPLPRDHEKPTPEETSQLTILSELNLKDPRSLHHSAWTLARLLQRAPSYPVHDLMMDFLRDSNMVDYILGHYEDYDVIRLRELRAIGSFVENLKKANQARPGVLLSQYVSDLDQLERHEIALAGEMVSSNQAGVNILTAHSSKGLEFQHVFIPFCVQDKSWPKREMTNKIPLPHELLIGQERIETREDEKKLHRYDENRLFYVAATRAKDRLVFTAAPRDKQVFSEFLSNAGLAPAQSTPIPEEETLIQLLKKSPQPDPVQFTSDTLKGLTQEISLSPSSVNRYLTCPRQFLYQHLLKTPQPKRTSLVYGHCVHKALEKSYRRYLKENVFPPVKYFEEQFLQELEWQGVEQSIRQGCLHKLEDAKRWYEQTAAQGAIKPLELERKLTRKMPQGLIFSGQFDKVDPAGKGDEATVVDYKTGEPDKHIKAFDKSTDVFSEECDDYFRQLIAYKMLYESGYRRRTVTHGQLVFLDPVRSTVKKYGLEEGAFTNKTVPLTQDMVKDYEKLISQTWEKIQGLQFDRLPEFDEKKCGYCPYQGVCWSNALQTTKTRPTSLAQKNAAKKVTAGRQTSAVQKSD